MHHLLWAALVELAAEDSENLGQMGWALEQLRDAEVSMVAHFSPAAQRSVRSGPPPGVWAWLLRFSLAGDEKARRLWRALQDTPNLFRHVGITIRQDTAPETRAAQTIRQLARSRGDAFMGDGSDRR